MLYIGTSNTIKTANMIALVNLINPILEVRDIFEFKFPPPKEVGSTESERALMKANYYFLHLASPVISEDDGIYFDKNLPVAMGKEVAATNQSIVGDKFSFWRQMFIDYSVTSGVLKKAYAIATDSFKDVKVVTVPFKIIISQDAISDTESFFNQFIVPDGFDCSLSMSSIDEKKAFRLKYLVTPVRELLIEAKIFDNKFHEQK